MHDFSREVWFNTYRYNKAEENDIGDTFNRVANAVGKDNYQKQSFFKILHNYYFCPGGRILSNAGTEFAGTTLFNCYVGPKPKHDQDSLEGIAEVLLTQMQTLKSEGGWGMNFSFLRPRGALIKKIGVETPGSVKYMELYNKASDIITAGSGKEKIGEQNKKNRIRKGAMMGVLWCWHPDIEEFIEAKRSANRLDKFNISIGCSNEFMEAVRRVEETGVDEDWNLIFPDTSYQHYTSEWDGDIDKWQLKGYPIVVHKSVSVKYLWEKIMRSTYDFNDPGVLFLDRANETYLFNYSGNKIHATNPCGEQNLPYGEVCDLGSLCLPFLLNSDYTGFDEEKVIFATRRAVQFLDRVNDISNTPCYEYSENAKNKRRIGLGIMGWGSALYLLKTRFGSDKAEKLKKELMGLITRTAVQESTELAREYGCYTGCDKEGLANHKFWKQIELPQTLIDNIRLFGMRNSALFSIQPTGNTSILYEVVSGGCEPVFLHEYIRTTIVQSPPDHIKTFCPKYWQGEFVETEMFKFTKEGEETILRGIDAEGTVYKIDKNRGLTKEVLCEDYGVKILKERGEWNPNADWAVTTNNLTVSDHIIDLRGWAKWIDSSISKTINLPNDYPYEDFKRIYLDAYKSGVIKGITTYRDGTMTSVLSSVDKKETNTIRRPKKLRCHIYHPTVKGRKYYAAIGLTDDCKPYEIFVGDNGIDKDVTEGFIQRIRNGRYSLISDNEVLIEDMGEHCSDEEEAVARLASISLRNGVDIQSIVDQLEKTKGSLSGFAKVMCRILRKYIPESTRSNDKCPECKNNLVYQEGCKKCVYCGFSKC